MERLKVQLAALMESQRKAAGYAEGPGRRIKRTSLRALPPALLRVGRMPAKKLRVDQRHARTASASRDPTPVRCRL